LALYLESGTRIIMSNNKIMEPNFMIPSSLIKRTDVTETRSTQTRFLELRHTTELTHTFHTYLSNKYRSILTVKCTLLIFNLTFILSSTQHVSAFASYHQV
jgi:hypothetical protein